MLTYELRPRVETFDYLGGRVEMVDLSQVLRQTSAEPVRLLNKAALPGPYRGLSVLMSVTPGAEGVRWLRLKAEIATAEGSAVENFVAPTVILVAQGLRVGGPLGAAAAGLVAYSAHRLRRALTPIESDVEAPDSTEVSDPETGLRASVAHAHNAIVLRAALPSEIVEPTHVRAFVVLALDVAREYAGQPTDPNYLAGHVFTLRPYPDGRWSDDDATVRLDQVGGLPTVVDQLREVAVSFKHPAAMARWGARRPQGILMYGPPGTGKTMLARALASEIGGTLREIRTPEILNKYVGESEANIKRIFDQAKRYTEPTVLFFDEFDSIISYTGAAFDAASQMFNGVAGIFKQEMNTLIEVNPNVIVVATTNFPERVDQSLIRSGRFDILLRVPRPDRASRADILGKILRGLIARYEFDGFRMFADDVDIVELAELSDGLTGADVKEVLRRLQMAKAMAEARGESSAPISQEDLKRGIGELRGSRKAVTAY